MTSKTKQSCYVCLLKDINYFLHQSSNVNLIFVYILKRIKQIWILKHSRISQLKICHFGILITLSHRHLKNNKYRKRLSLIFSYLTKDRTSKKNSIAISHQSGRLTFITGGETRSQHYTQTNFVTTILPPIFLLRTHTSFLKIFYSLP